MPKWLVKTFVTLVTIVTLGTVVPSVNYQTEQKPSSKENFEGHNSVFPRTEINVDAVAEQTNDDVEGSDARWSALASKYDDPNEMIAQLQAYTLEEAKKQGYLKFGETIGKRVGETYTNEILPKFGEAVTSVSQNLDVETIKHLAVSHNPAGGTGERILNLYDERNGKQVMKFHVRRDHPPLEGYWFTFHYHTAEDQYQMHHELGKIYWDKNTPPQWMA